VTYR